MTRATRPAAAPIEPVTAVCVEMYAADLVPASAFVFRVTATGTRFTVYADTENRYRVGAEYTLLLAARDMAGDKAGDVVPLPLTVGDAEFLRHCLSNAAQRWREAITEADGGTTAPDRQPHRSRPAEPGHVDVEPTPAGYRAARRLFADELDRVQRLADVLDRHIDRHVGRARAADSGGGQR